MRESIRKEIYSEEYFATLADVLSCRERRSERQAQLLREYETVVCLTLNVAGANKTSPLYKAAFFEGVRLIRDIMSVLGIEIMQSEILEDIGGDSGYFTFNQDALYIKRLVMQIEESLDIGRLFDIDVMGKDHVPISRTKLGGSERTCLICGKAGKGCARSRAHDIEEIIERTVGIICGHFDKIAADLIAENAVKALMYEVLVTPKPGLVDRYDNGSHRDMDVFTFTDSACSMYDYFRECATVATQNSEAPPSVTFSKIRYLGMAAQAKSEARTGGVNAHKGAVFSLGIMAAAVSYVISKGGQANSLDVLSVAAEMAGGALSDFEDSNSSQSTGKTLYNKNKIKGIRGEAALGYPTVREHALPILKKACENGHDLNTAGLFALASLIANVEDTNIIKRSSYETLEAVRARFKAALSKENLDINEFMTEQNEQFIALNISPGGCADLLAVAFFIYFTEGQKYLL